MNKADEKKWVKLRFVHLSDFVRLTYQDGLGNYADPEEQEFRTVTVYGLWTIQIPETIYQLLPHMVELYPTRRETFQDTKQIPTAVFIEHVIPPEQSKDYIFEINFLSSRLIEELFPGSGNAFQPVIYSPGKADTSFQLPFNVRYIGTSAQLAMDSLRGRNWYQNNLQVETYGLTIGALEDADFKMEEAVDVLVISSETFQNGIDARFSKARLLIIIGEFRFFQSLPDFLRESSPALLFVTSDKQDSTTDWLVNFFYGIIHDSPLHEALQDANQKTGTGSAVLFASPESNQDLRLNDALENFKAKVNEYHRTMDPGNVENFIKKFPSDYDPALLSRLTSSLSDIKNTTSYFSQIKNFGNNFNRETSGLVPLSYEYKTFKDYVQPEFDGYRDALQSLVNNKDLFQDLRDRQDRKVDVTFDELNPSLVYEAMSSNSNLQSDRQYRLNLIIGQRSDNSVMAGEIASIDPLLPDPEGAQGHVLEVVIFPKDFRLFSPSSVKIYLPLLGESEAARFILKPPSDDGQAQLRICVFTGNNLLQAFVLDATIGNARTPYGQDSAIMVRQDLSTTSKFTNIDERKERDLYIGINGNNNGSHSLFFKKDEANCEVHGLSERLIEDAQNEFRSLLQSAYFNPSGTLKFSSYSLPGDKISEEFFDQLRVFAKFGSKYADHILGAAARNHKMRIRLDEVRNTSNCSILISRHDPNYAFPWTVLYDYVVPPSPSPGEPDMFPVCMGKTFEAGQFEEFKNQGTGYGCPHNPGVQCYCIEGFWGYRHKIEQLLAGSESVDAVQQVRIKPEAKILFSCNSDDNDVKELYRGLAAHRPLVEEVTHTVPLLDRLWNKDDRPVMLIMLGQINTSMSEPRILSFVENTWPTQSGNIPEDRWIDHKLLLRYYKSKNRWDGEPNSIVLLINCSTAQLNVRSVTSIVTGFQLAGAAAVIGTECDITSGLAARFVREIMEAIYQQKKQLGEAIQMFNQNLAISGNPLAFVFTCYGNINLEFVNETV